MRIEKRILPRKPSSHPMSTSVAVEVMRIIKKIAPHETNVKMNDFEDKIVIGAAEPRVITPDLKAVFVI